MSHRRKIVKTFEEEKRTFLFFRKQAQAAKTEAEKEGIVVPITLEDYCIKTRARPAEQQLDMTDFYDDEYELDDDENEQLSASDYEDGDDSGNGES